MRSTSLEAFDKIKPELPGRESQVFNALIKLEFATNAMIAKYLNLPINCVTGRTKGLRDKKLVVESHKSWCPVTKNKAIYWRAIETFK